MSKKILLFSGDPNSVNSEIIFKCFKHLSSSIKKKIYIISNYQLLKEQFKKLNFSQKIVRVNSIDDSNSSDKIKVLDIKIKYKNVFKIPKKNNSYFLEQALNLSHKLSLTKKVAGFINCPINKNLLKRKNIGLTEIFAKKCKIKKNSEVMLIRNSKFAISPMTTHINLKDVSKKINKQLIYRKIITLNKWFKKYEKKKPKLCILGLNPHNAEFSKNSEEKKIILPVIKKLKKNGFKISGPLPADTIFINDYKNFDVIIGMYHDQVITPFKSMFKFDGINITLGLKYLRVSPDHGIASNLIGKNKANPKSLIECIKFINKFT